KFGMRWEIKQGKHFFSSEKNDGTPVDIYKYAGKESILKECEESLKRLKTDYIDLYQIHWPDVTTPIEESMEAVELLIKQGKVRAAGVSNYSTEDMKKAGTVINLASNQVAYSMVKRDIEEDIVPYSIENNVGILVYSPLQRGVLAGKIKPDTKFNNGDHRPTTAHYKNDNIIKINLFLEQIRPLAELKDVSLAQLVLRWTLQRPGISCILAGARNEEQLIENAGTLEFELSGEEISLPLVTLMAAPLKILPRGGSDNLEPLKTITLSFAAPMNLDDLGRMLSLEVRPLPGIGKSDSIWLTEKDFSIKELDRRSGQDPVQYRISLNRPIDYGKHISLHIRLSLDERIRGSVARYSFMTKPEFRLASFGSGYVRYPVAGSGSI
ncbi:hypothetical protein LCGC14_2925240, partial [marine sediment metagenome]